MIILKSLNRYLLSLNRYLFSLRIYFLVSFLIFVSGVIGGYYFAQNFSVETKEVILKIEEIFQPILEMNKISQILFIFLKNGMTSFLVILGGLIFGIFPVLSLFSNGEILGILAYLTFQKFNPAVFFCGILPHGLIEIFCFLICGAIGLKISKTLIDKIFKKEASIKDELDLALEFFLKVILILLFLAAILEVLITPEFLKFF